MSRLPLMALTLTMTAAALAPAPARADTLSTFTFAGQCADCAGTATASLVLQNYTLGQAIGDLNFVSFTYDGTNLFGPYTVTPADKPSFSGSIDPALPSPESVNINDSAIQFTSDSGGYWCTGAGSSCSLDYGFSHLWSAAAATTPVNSVPEPMTLSLLGAALLGLAARRRRT